MVHIRLKCTCRFVIRRPDDRAHEAYLRRGVFTDAPRIYIGGPHEVARSMDDDTLFTIPSELDLRETDDGTRAVAIIRAWHDANPTHCIGAQP